MMAIKEQKQTFNFMIHDLLRSMLQRKFVVVEDDKHTKSVMFLKKNGSEDFEVCVFGTLPSNSTRKCSG